LELLGAKQECTEQGHDAFLVPKSQHADYRHGPVFFLFGGHVERVWNIFFSSLEPRELDQSSGQ